MLKIKLMRRKKMKKNRNKILSKMNRKRTSKRRLPHNKQRMKLKKTIDSN